MLLLLLHTFTYICFLSDHVSAVAVETVVGVAGRRVTLPCRLDATRKRRAEVCWGRGQPSLFNCHNTVINAAGDKTTYRSSYRFSVSSWSLSIFGSRLSDSGFYHCRVQLPGLFNDQISTVHLVILTPPAVVSSSTKAPELHEKESPWSTAAVGLTTGSDVTEDRSGGPVISLVQSSVQQQVVNRLEVFIGNTVRVSFLIFIPALLLAATYRVWRTSKRLKTESRLNQSVEEEQEEQQEEEEEEEQEEEQEEEEEDTIYLSIFSPVGPPYRL